MAAFRNMDVARWQFGCEQKSAVDESVRASIAEMQRRTPLGRFQVRLQPGENAPFAVIGGNCSGLQKRKAAGALDLGNEPRIPEEGRDQHGAVDGMGPLGGCQ